MRKIKFKNSLFIKILSICLAAIIITMLINLVYATYSSSQALEEESVNSLSRLVLEKSKEVERVFDSQFALLDTWLQDTFAVDFFTELTNTGEIDEEKRKQLANILEDRFQQADGLYENIFFTYEDKVLVDGIDGVSEGVEMDEEKEKYYYDQLKNPGRATGNYMYSPITGRPTLPIINAMLDDKTNAVLTTLVIPLDVNYLTESLVKSDADDYLGTMILDPYGLVIAADNDELALNLNFQENEDVKEFFQFMKKENVGSGHFTLNGVEYIASYVKHEQHGFYILSYMPVSQYMESVDKLKSGIITVTLFSVLIAAIVIFFIIRTLVNPIKDVANAAEKIADGDLTVERLRFKNNDEVGILAAAFNKMLENLQITVQQVNKTSKNVASAAEEFSSSAVQLAEISKQVSEAIDEVAAGTDEQARHTAYSSKMIEDMTTGVKTVADNTQNTVVSATVAMEKANAGVATVSTSIAEINTVNDNIHQMAEKLKHLGERSKEIGQIVDVITDIAEQTNLLALNAAIEAARAGENGRGFAIVADEVRNLAEQSRASTEQIKQLVTSILNETEETIHYMDETVKQSADGLAAITSVDQTFYDIQNSVNEVTKEVEEVSAAAEEISAAILQIHENMKEITDISTATASQTEQVSSAMEEQLASSEEIASASDSMEQLARELQDLVEKFKITK